MFCDLRFALVNEEEVAYRIRIVKARNVENSQCRTITCNIFVVIQING